MRKSLIREFASLVGEANVLAGEADRYSYAFDSAPPLGSVSQAVPGMVLRPTRREDLGRAVALCHEEGLPLTVRGAGTNLSGGAVPSAGGVVVLTGALNRILEVREADLYAVAEPGVVTAVFAAEMERRGLFYPPDPGSQAVSTLGGNVAENAGGLRGLKYGVTKDYVMGLDFFDARGELVRAGSRTVKCVTGLNLAQLLVGSEGTLGVIEKIVLRLIPPPAARRSLMGVFGRLDQASEAVARIIAEKIVPATLEFLDNVTIRAVEDKCRAGLPVEAGALLLAEVDGHPAQVAEDAERVERVMRACGADDVQAARDEAERDRVWQARRDALPALARLRPTTVLEDATVPRSRIPEMVAAIEAISRQLDLTIGVFGHAGDGNLHPTILTDRRDAAQWTRVERAVDLIFERALDLGGTLSGEHGIGLAKSRYMVNEVGPATMRYARAIKAAVDPKGILNPGKILGDEPSPA